MKEKMLLDNVKKLKKWRILIAVFLAFVMSISLMCTVACESGNPQEEKPGPGPEQPFDPDSPGEPDDEGSTVERVEITDVGADILLCDSVINQYFTSETPEEQIAVLKNHATITAENGGVPVRFSWKGNGSVKYTLYLSDNENFDNADTYVSSGLKTEIDVYNLLPATTYYYKVEGTRPGDCSDTLQFSTNSASIRYIVADGAANTRDIGGYKSNNGTVNYGKIYRGSFAGGINGLTDDGRNTFEKELKIKTEIDLRKDAKQKSEYLSENVGYYKFDVGSYTDIFDVATRNSLDDDALRDSTDKSSEIKKFFEVLADENNYPVIIHCENGADSTGTMAFLINALLGVSEGDLIKDFELSTFSKLSGARYRSAMNADGTAFDDTGVMQNDSEAFVAFGATINALRENYGMEGKSLSYAVENYLTSYVGVSSTEIENVKKIMLSEYTPSEIEYVGGDRQVIEVSKSNNSVNLGEIVYSSVEGVSVNNVDLGNSLSAIDGSMLADFYGERELTVIVNTENGQKIVKVPVLIVTKYISTADDLKTALKISEQGNYGYYELTKDITLDAFANDVEVAFNGGNGFCGIFEGNGNTITSTPGNHGLFGYVSGGATIRNVNFNVTGNVNVSGKTVIGDYIVDSRIENVKVNILSETEFGEDGAGIISAEAFNGNTVNGLTINAENAFINSLFGGSAHLFAGNEFDACEIRVQDIKEIARNYIDGKYVSVYLEDVEGFGGEISSTVEISVADIININGSTIELSVGERFANSKITVIECNDKEINEYKFANGVLYLYNDSEIFGEIGGTVINITFEGVNGIPVNTKISAVIFTNSEEITLDGTQEIFVDRENNSVDLKEYSGADVYSISCNGYYFGKDETSLHIDAEFRNNTLIHGSNMLTVLIGKDSKYYTLQIPVTVITKEISNVDQFNELLKSDNAEYAIYGYYKLTANIGDPKSEFNNGNDKNWQNVDGLYGFRGTLDGAGYSVTGTVFARGLIGLVGKGAVIKNLTVNAYGYADGRTILARSIRSAVIENVTINIKSGESVSYLTEGGIITALMSHSTIYRNIDINSDGKVDTLFGCSYWNYDPSKANTFENVKVTVKSIGGLLCLRANIAESLYTIDGVEGITVAYVRSYEDESNTVNVGSAAEITLGEENADITEINSITFGGSEIDFTFENGILTITEEAFTYSDIGAQTLILKGKVGEKQITVSLGVTIVLSAEEVSLGDKEIVLADGTEYALDLGDYSDSTVIAATLGGENVTYENGKLIVTEEYKANSKKHGMQTLKVTVSKEGKYYIVSVNVLVVTKAISTIEELTAAMTAGPDNVVYGYYKLTQNVGSGEAWINVQNNGDWKNPDGSVGFRGTLDGAGFAVDGQFATHGLFGIIGNGAVVKNITFNVYFYQNGRQTLARSITGATIEDVTINIKSVYGTLDATAEGGLITGLMSHTSHYKNVTINAEGKDLDTLFGKSYGNYKADKANTFENCVVNANSLAGLVHSNEIIPATGISGLTIPE